MKLGEFLNNKFWDFDIIKGKVKDELNENTEVELIKLCTEDVEDSMIGFDPKVGDYAPIDTLIDTRLVAYFKLDDAVIRYKVMRNEISNFKDYGVKAVFIGYTTWGVNYRLHKLETVNVNKKEVIELWNYMNSKISELEKEYEKQLYQWLRAKKYSVVHESLRRGARFDLVLGDDEIAVELKIIRSSGDFRHLIGQILQYRDQFRKIIIVLIDQFRNPSIMKKEIRRIKEMAPKDIEVVIK